MANILIFGASRGLGAAFATGVPDSGDQVWCVSRTRPAVIELTDGITRHWLCHDLTQPQTMAILAEQLGDQPIDLLLYNAGIWEKTSFLKTSDAEIQDIVSTNLTSLLLAIRHLSANLQSAGDARVVLIGSTAGLDNAAGADGLAYVATKFAVRGAAHSLREMLRPHRIPVTVISPGGIATDVPLAAGKQAALDKHNGSRIPMGDLVDIVRLLRQLSSATCAKEIILPATADMDA